MPLTTLQWVRKLLEDDPAPNHEIAFAAGDESDFFVANPPITTGTSVVRVDGVAQTLGVDYTLGVVGGQNVKVVFVTPPAEGARVEIEYVRQTWADDELETYINAANTTWLTDSVESVYEAAIFAVDTLMVGAATALNFGSGEETYDMVSVWERLVQLRTTIWGPWLETRYDQPALAIADLVFDVDDPDLDWENLGFYGIYAFGR